MHGSPPPTDGAPVVCAPPRPPLQLLPRPPSPNLQRITNYGRLGTSTKWKDTASQAAEKVHRQPNFGKGTISQVAEKL
jgi:hypothetical protein